MIYKGLEHFEQSTVYIGLEKVKQSAFYSYKREHRNSFQRMNEFEISKIRTRLDEKIMKRDYGDERDVDEFYWKVTDIEVDGDYILDYSNCRTARDFREVTDKVYKRKKHVHTSKSDKEANKMRVVKKFKSLQKNKGLRYPRIDELALWLSNEAYQDKVKIYQELIDVLHDEIDEYNSSITDDFPDFEIPW